MADNAEILQLRADNEFLSEELALLAQEVMELRRLGSVPAPDSNGESVAGQNYAETMRTEGLAMQLSNIGPVLRRYNFSIERPSAADPCGGGGGQQQAEPASPLGKGVRARPDSKATPRASDKADGGKRTDWGTAPTTKLDSAFSQLEGAADGRLPAPAASLFAETRRGEHRPRLGYYELLVPEEGAAGGGAVRRFSYTDWAAVPRAAGMPLATELQEPHRVGGDAAPGSTVEIAALQEWLASARPRSKEDAAAVLLVLQDVLRRMLRAELDFRTAQELAMARELAEARTARAAAEERRRDAEARLAHQGHTAARLAEELAHAHIALEEMQRGARPAAPAPVPAPGSPRARARPAQHGDARGGRTGSREHALAAELHAAQGAAQERLAEADALRAQAASAARAAATREAALEAELAAPRALAALPVEARALAAVAAVGDAAAARAREGGGGSEERARREADARAAAELEARWATLGALLAGPLPWARAGPEMFWHVPFRDRVAACRALAAAVRADAPSWVLALSELLGTTVKEFPAVLVRWYEDEKLLAKDPALGKEVREVGRRARRQDFVMLWEQLREQLRAGQIDLDDAVFHVSGKGRAEVLEAWTGLPRAALEALLARRAEVERFLARRDALALAAARRGDLSRRLCLLDLAAAEGAAPMPEPELNAAAAGVLAARLRAGPSAGSLARVAHAWFFARLGAAPAARARLAAFAAGLAAHARAHRAGARASPRAVLLAKLLALEDGERFREQARARAAAPRAAAPCAAAPAGAGAVGRGADGAGCARGAGDAVRAGAARGARAGGRGAAAQGRSGLPPGAARDPAAQAARGASTGAGGGGGRGGRRGRWGGARRGRVRRHRRGGRRRRGRRGGGGGRRRGRRRGGGRGGKGVGWRGGGGVGGGGGESGGGGGGGPAARRRLWGGGRELQARGVGRARRSAGARRLPPPVRRGRSGVPRGERAR